MRIMDLPGFEIVRGSRHFMAIKPPWKEALLKDLANDFAGVPSDRRRSIQGRTEHFSYQPEGASERFMVRFGSHGGPITFMGKVFVGYSRPLQEIRIQEHALRSGVPVPEIVAVRVTRLFPGLYRFVTVMKEIDRAQNLLTLIQRGQIQDKRSLIRSLAHAISTMHRAGISHGDLNLKNILIQSTDSSAYNITIVDLDRSRISSGPLNEKRRLANLQRLFRSLEKCTSMGHGITRVDRGRFVRDYCDDKNRVRHFMGNCTRGIWRHRLWWFLSNEKTPRK